MQAGGWDWQDRTGRPPGIRDKGEGMQNEQDCVAYAVGYHDGRAVGVSDVPLAWQGQLAETLYKRGYDRGVADYCAEELDTTGEA